MKESRFTKVLLIIIGVLLSLNLVVLLLSNPPSSYAAKSIQYKFISSEGLPYNIDKEGFEKLFNEYGKEGWEFVAPDLNTGLYIFKR